MIRFLLWNTGKEAVPVPRLRPGAYHAPTERDISDEWYRNRIPDDRNRSRAVGAKCAPRRSETFRMNGAAIGFRMIGTALAPWAQSARPDGTKDERRARGYAPLRGAALFSGRCLLLGGWGGRVGTRPYGLWFFRVCLLVGSLGGRVGTRPYGVRRFFRGAAFFSEAGAGAWVRAPTDCGFFGCAFLSEAWAGAWVRAPAD